MPVGNTASILPHLHEGKDVWQHVWLVVRPEGGEGIWECGDRSGRHQISQVKGRLQPQQEQVVWGQLELMGASECAQAEQIKEGADNADGQHGRALNWIAEGTLVVHAHLGGLRRR